MLFKILACFTGLIAVIIVVGSLNYKRMKARQRKDFQAIFGSPGESYPTLQFGTGMGWPTFTVIFENMEALEVATSARKTDAFKQRISSYYGPDFDANLAVGFQYEGQYDKWLKK